MKSLLILFATLLLATICLTENAVAQQAGSSSLGALAYIRGGELWVQELPDGEARRLTTDADDSSPLWSPSGQWLAFRKGDQLRLIHKSGADARTLNHGESASQVAWSPLSDMLAYTTRTGDLVVASAGDGSERTLVSSPTPREGSGVQSFAWSADGKWIAYALQKDLKPPQSDQPPDLYAGLWRIRADGGGPVEIFGGPIAFGVATPPSGTNPYGGAIVADWSRDGQNILFWTYPFSESLLADGTALNIIAARIGKPKELDQFTLAYPDYLSLSPDGRFLAVSVGGGRESWSNKRIAVVELSSGKPSYLTDEKTTALSPTWSPDGRLIAYVAQPDHGFESGINNMREAAAPRHVWVMNRNGSNPRQLTHDANYRDERPLWSADGTHILFARIDKNMQAALWLMRADGDESQKIAELVSEPDRQFGYYGHIDWDGYFDWWRPKNPAQLPDTGGISANSFLLIVIGMLGLLIGLSLIALEKSCASK